MYVQRRTYAHTEIPIAIHAHSCSIKEDIYALHIKRLTRRKVTASRNRTGDESGVTHFNCRDTAAAFVPPHLVKQQFVELISYPRIHIHINTQTHTHTRTAWSMEEHTSESKTLCVLLTLTPSQIYVHTHSDVRGLVASHICVSEYINIVYA